MSTATSRVTVALLGLLTTACASAGTLRPRLSEITPASVTVVAGNVVELDLRGAGFDTSSSSGNTVRIGLLVLTGVSSMSGGTIIRLALPPAVPSGGEAPPSPWLTGRYPVSVTTKGGTSDTLSLSIRAGGIP